MLTYIGKTRRSLAFLPLWIQTLGSTRRAKASSTGCRWSARLMETLLPTHWLCPRSCNFQLVLLARARIFAAIDRRCWLDGKSLGK
ncbi:hypothetical protein F4809DRAFT_593979 [Biscogniauxia mediterranea]|nr:hypothetical protein F4809DRAFT_593979 [Biscogniauxia mediterranea]